MGDTLMLMGRAFGDGGDSHVYYIDFPVDRFRRGHPCARNLPKKQSERENTSLKVPLDRMFPETQIEQQSTISTLSLYCMLSALPSCYRLS